MATVSARVLALAMPFLTTKELLHQVVGTSRKTKQDALRSWVSSAVESSLQVLGDAFAASALDKAWHVTARALSSSLRHAQLNMSSTHAAACYINFRSCESDLKRAGLLNDVQRIKAAMRDIVVACISREVGIQNEGTFDRRLQECFGVYLMQDEQILPSLKKAFHDSMRRADLKTAFRSAASLKNERRQRPRRKQRGCRRGNWQNIADVEEELSKKDFQDTVYFSKEQVQKFFVEVGQTFPWYVSSQDNADVPFDIAMVVCWKCMIRSITTDSRIGSVGLLRLLHLESRFKQLNERRMLSDSDKFENNFSVAEIQNTPTGKRVTTRGTVTHEGCPWVIVTSSFFIPTDITSSEDIKASKGIEIEVIHKTYIVKLESDSQMAVLTDKGWFQFQKQPRVGETLRIEIISQDMKHRDDGTFDVSTVGGIFKENEAIGKVVYRGQHVAKNALVAFLDRTAIDYPPYKDINCYEMLQNVDEITFPTHMDRYSSVSGDIHPIHTDEYFARIGGLENPIVHGMWLNANARRVLSTYVGQRDNIETEYFRCMFAEKVNPGETLRTSLRHIGMRDGKLVMGFSTVDTQGNTVCSGWADIRQPNCAFTFTGQGSVRVGMGMDLYESSEVARKIWDEADAHFLACYGISILEIVKENPKEKTVHFGGPQGNKRREFYMSLTRSTDEGTAPLFPEIKPLSTSYTFKSPTGLLFATQFTQPALALAEMVQYKDSMSELRFPNSFMFAGHSLSEYAALASITGCFQLGNLLDVIFLRGMTMQSVVPRDAKNREALNNSCFVMVRHTFIHVQAESPPVKTRSTSCAGRLQT